MFVVVVAQLVKQTHCRTPADADGAPDLIARVSMNPA
jgi:hypothetical protein